MLFKIGSGNRKNEIPVAQFEAGNEFRSCRGDFVGIVQAREAKYEFSVRDIRRERPTIHGSGMDFTHAVTAVTQLLDALAGEASGAPSSPQTRSLM